MSHGTKKLANFIKAGYSAIVSTFAAVQPNTIFRAGSFPGAFLKDGDGGIACLTPAISTLSDGTADGFLITRDGATPMFVRTGPQAGTLRFKLNAVTAAGRAGFRGLAHVGVGLDTTGFTPTVGTYGGYALGGSGAVALVLPDASGVFAANVTFSSPGEKFLCVAFGTESMTCVVDMT